MRLNYNNGAALLAILAAASISLSLVAQAPDNSIAKAVDHPVAHFDSGGLVVEDALKRLVPN
jgi:hypothetical protein